MLIIEIFAKIFLLLLSLASFIPQLRRLRALQDFNGISLIYILLNLIVATEQLALGVHLIAVGDEYLFVHDLPSLGDWLDVCQFGVVWFCHLLLFYACFRCQPSKTRLKTSVFIAYFAFLLISLVPVAFESTLGTGQYDGWFFALFGGYHCFYISPVVTLLGMASLYFQARETLSRTSVGAISLVGLASQAIIFALVGSTWTFRLTASRDFFKSLTPLRAFIKWYQLVGWAAVDNLVFAFVQAVLFCIAWNRRGEEGAADETTRLLG